MTAIDVRDDLLSVVERLRPVIEEHAAQAEADRQLSAEVYQAMPDGDLFKMYAPREYGGLELPIVDIMTVWEAVARIDSAAAWNLLMNQVFTGLAAFLSDDGAREVFANGPTTAAGAFFPPAAATKVDGGWRVTGRVPFASGCHHTAWCAMAALEMDGDQPKLDPATGQPTGLAMIFPQSNTQVLDVVPAEVVDI